MTLQERLSFYGVLLLIYLLNPFVGILLTTFVCLRREERDRGLVFFLFVLLAFWMGGINMTKEPASDMIGYLRHFHAVPERGFVDNVFRYEKTAAFGHEWAYGLVNYLGYYLSLGRAPLYVFYLTVAFYLLTFSLLYKVYDESGCPTYMLLGAAFLVAFLPQVFGFTVHLVRQMLATAMALYAISYRMRTGRNHWVLLGAATLVHTMMGVLAFLSVVPMLYRRLKFWQLLSFVGLVIIFVLANVVISRYFVDSSSETLAYASSRFGAKGAMEGADTMQKYIFTVVFFIIYAKTYFSLRHSPDHPVWGFMNITLCFAVFIVSFASNPFIQFRFTIVFYVLFAMSFLFLFWGWGMLEYWGTLLSCLAMIVYFFVHLNSMGWIYIPSDKLLTYPFFMLCAQAYPS